MFLIFDTETTGRALNFNAPLTDFDNWPRLVQISWQLHDEKGRLIENQDYIIKPDGFDIPFNAFQIHGISTEKALREGHDLKEILAKFNEVLAKTKVVAGHNVIFDYSVMGAEFLRMDVEDHLKIKPYIDTMEYGTDVCQLPGGRGGKFKFPKLSELYEKLFDTGFDEAHNSAADVNATARAFFEMMRLEIYPPEKILFTDAMMQAFRQANPDVIQPFDIVIRDQVAQSKKGQQERTQGGSARDVDLGRFFHFYNHSIYSILQSTTKISELVDCAAQNDFPAVGLVDLGNMMGAFKFVNEVETFNEALAAKQNQIRALQEAEKENRLAQYVEEENHEEGKDQNELLREAKVLLEKADQELARKPLIPILGQVVYISERYQQKQFTKDDPDRRVQAVLLAKNFTGYKNLIKISTIGFKEGFYAGVPRIDRQVIEKYKGELIAITGGMEADIPATILEYGEQRGEEAFKWWLDTFGEDFYVQIQNHGLEEEAYINSVLIGFAKKYEVKVLAQNETYYTRESDFRIQEIISCIKDGEKLSAPVGRGFGRRRSLQSDQFYLRDRNEVKEAFKNYPETFGAYEEFFEKFAPYRLKHDILLPKFEIPEQFHLDEDEIDGGKRGEMAYLTHLTMEGAKKRYPEMTSEIKERLDFELDIIRQTGYPGYFLIVQDFCAAARSMGVSVGPGRGSAAGSAVAYCIGITNVDPIKYDLLFERFLNPERISMPDIDIDFDDEGRAKVIKWVIDKYGQEQVAQIITYSILGGKSAIKDAGRVLEVPIPETNEISKLIPATPGMNIAKVLKSDLSKFRPEDVPLVQEIRRILETPEDPRFTVLDSAYKMEGCVRNTGVHACGVIIAPEDISNLVPVTIAAKDAEIQVSQFDNSVAESAGLLKMDFLGLRTLTILKDALKLIKAKHNLDIDLDEIPLDDPKTYKLFQEGRTIGIFQYESAGMQKYMRDLQPTVFADLIAMNALYRPGPIKYIPNFIKRKHGLEDIEYDLPEMEEYLKETYGITVYQEQVMLLSQKLAGFTKGEADTLRKAMGKKKKSVLDKMFPKFLEGGKKNNLDEEKLQKIWKDWEAFAAYAFNKSHSTCYAYVAYQTAYLKAHYPAEFMASVMTNNINDIKQITLFMEDCKAIGVDVLGPSVNESQYAFSVNDKGQIRFGLGAIKGIGEGPSEAICGARTDGRYTDVFNFFERIPANKINKRVVESLVYAGAFDELDHYHRAQYFEPDTTGKTNIEKLLRYGSNYQENKNSIETSLFADFADEVQVERPRLNPSNPWPRMFKLNREKEVIGFYLSSHPLDEFAFEYRFLQGLFSRNIVLAENNEIKKEEDTQLALNFDYDVDSDTEDDIPDLQVAESEDGSEDAEIEEVAPHVEPQGEFRFLTLDEVNKYQDVVFKRDFTNLSDEEKTEYRNRKFKKQTIKENFYLVAGLVTDYTVKDGYASGTKIAFITLEDYSGSYSFRLNDQDYMRFKESLAVDRFLVFKIKFSPSKDFGRLFTNVEEVSDLREAFESYAKKLSLVLPVEQVTEDDVVFFKNELASEPGDQILSVLLQEKREDAYMEVEAKKVKIHITKEMIGKLHDYRKYKMFLN